MIEKFQNLEVGNTHMNSQANAEKSCEVKPEARFGSVYFNWDNGQISDVFLNNSENGKLS